MLESVARVARVEPVVEGRGGRAAEAAARAERKVRLLIAYRHALLRQGLRLLLSTEPDLEVLDEASDGREAIDKAQRLKPDVVLLDMSLPTTGALEPTRTIKRQVDGCKVIVLTAAATEEDVLGILQSGASGCVMKDSDARELGLAVQAVHRGGAYLSPAISQRMIGDYLRLARKREDRGKVDVLSSREQEVLLLVVQGRTNQQIADELYVSVKTVEAHKAKIQQKLGIKNRAELVKYALRRGLIDLDPAPSKEGDD